MRSKVCERLPADHPFQPPMIKPLSYVPADVDVVNESVVPEPENIIDSSCHPSSSNQTLEISILENLVSHYSGELPGVESNLERASEVASGEVTLESPQQQEPNLQMTSTTLPNISVPEHIESQSSLEKVSEPDFMITSEDSDDEVELSNSSSVIITSVSEQPSEINIPTNNSTNDQPSSSSQAIQPCAPAKINVPSPPTLFLDFTILVDVCENIFQELNNLVQARTNLVHKDSYEKQWKILKERVDFVLSELQRTCLTAQGMLHWKRKTSSLEKKVLNRCYCCLNTSQLQKLS